MSGIYSPSANNYQIGKGFLIFTEEGGQPTHLGNCPKVVYTPNVTVLPHFSSMAGTKIQDFSVITQKGGSVAVDMEELTANNLSYFFLGSIDDTNPDAIAVGIFDRLSQIKGRLQYYATNDVGPRWYFDLTRVQIAPTGQFNPISDAYNAMTVTMTHVADDNGVFGTMTLKPDVSAIIPENILVPFIYGAIHPGTTPAFAQVGETMTCSVGAWVGAQSYAFQWFRDGNEISGADAQTYVPTVSDEGLALTCRVTATNTNGSAVAVSGPTAHVHP